MCAPVMSTYIMGAGRNAKDGLQSFMVFTLGRVFVYAALGAVSGAIGRALMDSTEAVRYAGWICSAALILIGLLMLARPVQGGCSGCKNRPGMLNFVSRRVAFNPTAHMILLGAMFSLVPCPPMAAMLLFSMGMPSIFSGALVMSLFAVGTALSPLLVICALAGWLSRGMRRSAPPRYAMLFQRLSGALLIAFGCVPLIS
jgi:sulfite exporter TauE/SafE